MLSRLTNKLLGRSAPPRAASDDREGGYDDRANPDDIHYCFRLILGRLPSIGEWKGHSSRAGEPLVDVVRTYVNSAEFKNRSLMEAELPASVVEGHNGKFHIFADQNDRIIGSPALSGTYEPAVTAALERLVGPGDQVLDVGANLGYFTLLAASLVGPGGHVVAVEPNELNVKLLESSRRRNGFENITVAQVAATNVIETLFLHATVGNGSVTALGDADSIFDTKTVPGIPLDVLLARRTQPIKLIKIDVEGFEYMALQGAVELLRQDKPHIVFEFSADGIEGIKARDFLLWLEGFGYDFEVLCEGEDTGHKQPVEQVLQAFTASQSDHIDVLASQR